MHEDELEERLHRSLKAHGTPMCDKVLGPLLRASPVFFGTTILKGPLHPPWNGKFLVAPHHLIWEDLEHKHDRICVIASRSSGKSMFWSFLYVLWRMARDAKTKGFIFSGTEPQAQRLMGEITQEVMENPCLQWLYPKGRDKKWTGGHIRCANGHELRARGFRTKVRGFHPDYIINDDILSEEDSYSEMQRNKTKHYYYSAVQPMLTRHGKLINVGTPMNNQDLLYGDLRIKEGYGVHILPALDPVTDQSTWPEAYDTAYLHKERREMGSIHFAREKMCRPVTDDASLFPLTFFHQDEVMQPTVCLGQPKSFWDSMGVRRVFIGVDFAFSSSVQADYFVIFVMGLDAHENRQVIDIFRARGVGFEEQKSRIVEYGQKYQPQLMYLESNQAQRIVADDLIRKTSLPIRKYNTGTERHTLDMGIPSLRLLLENRKFRLPRGDARSVELTNILIDEMHNFTWVNGRAQSVGGHDDTCLALYFAEQAQRSGGFKFSGMNVVPTSAPRPNTAPTSSSAPPASEAQQGQIVWRHGMAVRS